MLYANLNGAELAYEVCGDGPPLIFVHGFLARGTGNYYEALKRRLGHDYRVHALDMRSHGGSAAVRDEVTLTRCASDVVAFARSLKADAVTFVGHSMGGYIGMAAAIAEPSLFQALALVNSAASKGEPFPEEFIRSFMAARGDRDAMRQQFGTMFVESPGDEALDRLGEAALCLPDDVAEQWLRREWSHHDIEDAISSIELPVLSLIGARDTVVAPSRQYGDASAMPRAKIITFTDQGHMLPLENPYMCALEIARFFGELPRRPSGRKVAGNRPSRLRRPNL